MKKLKKIDNAGFSLVELLVAVVILGLIVAPLLHTFVTASDTAARSRKMGDATLASQNIAETIEANDLTDFTAAGNMLFGTAATVDASQAATGTYTITLPGVQAGKSTFKAQVELNAAAAAFTAINTQTIADYSNMDAVFAQSQDAAGDPDQSAIAYFVSASSTYTTRTTTPVISRFIKLTVTETDEKIKAELTYNYICTFDYTEVNTSGGTNTKTAKLAYSVPTYSLLPQGFDISKGQVPNIYFMYNPWYAGAYTDSATGFQYEKSILSGSTGDTDIVASNKNDTIHVMNLDDVAFNLFLVKQKTADVNKTGFSDYSYLADIVLHQSSQASTAVYSNAKESFTTLTGNTTLSGINFKIMYNTWSYQPLTGNVSGKLVSESRKYRIYQVTIKIYNRDIADDDMETATPLCEFTTSKLQ